MGQATDCKHYPGLRASGRSISTLWVVGGQHRLAAHHRVFTQKSAGIGDARPHGTG
jgi:hypothetical protein